MGCAAGGLVGLLLAFVLGSIGAVSAGWWLPSAFLLAIAGAFVGYQVVDLKLHTKRMDEARVQHQAMMRSVVEEHGLDEAFVASESGQFIGIAWDAKRIALKGRRGGAMTLEFANLVDLEVEIQTETFTETESETRTNRGSQIFGAAVGGLAFGPAGAIVGGLSAPQTTSSSTSSSTMEVGYVLRCRTLDRKDPLHEIEFYRSSSRVLWPPLAERKNAIQRFHAHLSNIVHMNSTSDNKDHG